MSETYRESSFTACRRYSSCVFVGLLGTIIIEGLSLALLCPDVEVGIISKLYLYILIYRSKSCSEPSPQLETGPQSTWHMPLQLSMRASLFVAHDDPHAEQPLQ